MSERKDATRFGAAVDSMLSMRGEVLDAAHRPADLSDDLDVARALTAMDFTSRSARLPELQAQVIGRFSSGDGRGFRDRRRSIPFKIAIFIKKPLFIAALCLCFTLVLVQCLTPGGIPAAGEAIGRFVTSTLKLGRATSVVTVDDTGRPTPAPSQRAEWRIATPIGTVSGDVPDGAPQEGWHFRTIAEARAGAPKFPFLTPASTPDGYQLSGLLLSPDKDWLIVTYTKQADPDVLFVAHNDARGKGMKFVTDRHDIVELSFGGVPAAWVDGRVLVWEQGSVSYALGGAQLSQAQAVHIAGSFR